MSRAIGGFAIGGAAPIAFVFIGEIADPKWRGKLGEYIKNTVLFVRFLF